MLRYLLSFMFSSSLVSAIEQNHVPVLHRRRVDLIRREFVSAHFASVHEEQAARGLVSLVRDVLAPILLPLLAVFELHEGGERHPVLGN